VLAEPDTPYDHLVQVMDAVRVQRHGRRAKLLRAELFPNISIGDAPVRAAARPAATAAAPPREPADGRGHAVSAAASTAPATTPWWT
jgi:ribosomal protein L12E/L44/L45/RPP1/RPP2